MSAASRLPRALLTRAAAPYRAAGLYPWFFARGKLQGDPAFAALLRLGLIPSQARLLDLGCGQGLLAALLCAADAPGIETGWPNDWAEPPRGVQIHGIERAARDVQRAQCVAGAGAGGASVRFEQADIRTAELGRPDLVVLLDVLHYLDFAEQQLLLARVFDCLTEGGTVLLRVADADAGLGFRSSVIVDKLVLAARGARRLRLYCRPLAHWRALLLALGFSVRVQPMHAGTPFANQLLLARRARSFDSAD